MWIAGLLAGLLLGWIFLPMPMGVCGIYNANAAPAWVQAIGSVAAILVATGIPWWQARTKGKEAARQLSVATLRLRSNLEALGKAALDRAASLRGTHALLLTNTVADLLRSITLAEADKVIAHVNNVHHFQQRIQEPILSLLEEYDQYTTEHERLQGISGSEKTAQFEISRSGLITRLERISKLSFDASNAIRLVDEEQTYPDIRARNLGGRP